MLVLFILIAAAGPVPDVLVLEREGDALSEGFAESMSAQPPLDARVLSAAQVTERAAKVGIIPTALDDNERKAAFKTDRDASKATLDPGVSRTLLERAIASAKTLSAMQLEYRQVALRVATEQLARLIHATNPASPDLDAVLQELAVRAPDTVATSLGAALGKRFSDALTRMQNATPGTIEITADGTGEFSLDGGPFKILQPAQSVSVAPGPHEVFVRWREGLGWTRKVFVTAGAKALLPCSSRLERFVLFTSTGVRIREAIKGSDAQALAALLRVQEIWMLDRIDPTSTRLFVWRASSARTAMIAASEPVPSVVRMAVASAREGKPAEPVSGFVAKQIAPAEFRVEAGVVENAAQTPVYKKWWFWTIMGGVVLVGAGAVTAGVLLSQPQTSPNRDVSISLGF